MISSRSIEQQMRKGFLEFAVLLIINEGDVYSSDIINKLEEAGLTTGEGTIYPLLSRLKREKLIEYFWQESKDSPPRKYYNLTEQGRNKMKIYQEVWSNLSNSINILQK